jgi:hypothetical protein
VFIDYLGAAHLEIVLMMLMLILVLVLYGFLQWLAGLR